MTDDRIKELQRQIAKLSGTITDLAGERPTLLFRDFASEYLAVKLKNPTLRASTKQSFENQVRNHLIPRFGAQPIDRINNAEWLYWVTEEKRITRFFNARKALIEILTAARNDGHIEKVPKLENPDKPKNVGRALSDKEVLSILWRSRSPFRFIFYTLWKMGCRPREVLRWEWSMIRWNEPNKTWIDIPARISKTDRSRSIPLNPDVSRLLYRRYVRGNMSQYVFHHRDSREKPQLTYQSAWTSACRKARVNAVPYDLRRTFITRCAAEGKPMIYVAKALDTSMKMVESTYAKSQVEVMEGIVK